LELENAVINNKSQWARECRKCVNWLKTANQEALLWATDKSASRAKSEPITKPPLILVPINM